MDLKGFKRIFLVEYAHRVYGNFLGILFAAPMIYFWSRGYFLRPMKKRMLGLLLLGGSQGLIGWWMVRSGLLSKPNYQTKPRVSVYRLFVHLNTAIGIFSILLWNGLTLTRGTAEIVWKSVHENNMLKSRKLGMIAIHFLAATIAAGSIVAGIDGGKVFNTWPLMNGALELVYLGFCHLVTSEKPFQVSETSLKI